PGLAVDVRDPNLLRLASRQAGGQHDQNRDDPLRGLPHGRFLLARHRVGARPFGRLTVWPGTGPALLAPCSRIPRPVIVSPNRTGLGVLECRPRIRRVVSSRITDGARWVFGATSAWRPAMLTWRGRIAPGCTELGRRAVPGRSRGRRRSWRRGDR